MTIGIVGSRRRDSVDDFTAIENAVKSVYQARRDSFVSGGCPKGADRFAEAIARRLGATITIHHADWNNEGRYAGFVRNTLIADDSDVLIACVAPDRKGGTEDTIKKFVKVKGEGKLFLV